MNFEEQYKAKFLLWYGLLDKDSKIEIQYLILHSFLCEKIVFEWEGKWQNKDKLIELKKNHNREFPKQTIYKSDRFDFSQKKFIEVQKGIKYLLVATKKHKAILSENWFRLLWQDIKKTLRQQNSEEKFANFKISARNMGRYFGREGKSKTKAKAQYKSADKRLFYEALIVYIFEVETFEWEEVLHWADLCIAHYNKHFTQIQEKKALAKINKQLQTHYLQNGQDLTDQKRDYLPVHIPKPSPVKFEGLSGNINIIKFIEEYGIALVETQNLPIVREVEPQPPTSNKNIFLVLATSFIMLFGVIFLWWFTNMLSTNKPENLSKNEKSLPKLTQTDMDKIKIEKIGEDIDERGSATVQYVINSSALDIDLDKVELYVWGEYYSNAQARRITKTIDTLTMSYEVPGARYIGVSQNKGIKHQGIQKVQNFILKSREWFAYATSSGNKIISELQEQRAVKPKGYFYFPTRDIRGDTSNFTTHYGYAQAIPVSMDSFTIEARVKLTEPEGFSEPAYHSILSVFGKEIPQDKIQLKMVNKSTTRWLGTYIGKTLINGESHGMDILKKFARPLEELQDWHSLKIRVKKGHCWLYFNDKLVYTQKVDKFESNISYLKLEGKGTQLVDYVRVWNGEGKLVYGEEFEE